jgi:hypothetical protein
VALADRSNGKIGFSKAGFDSVAERHVNNHSNFRAVDYGIGLDAIASTVAYVSNAINREAIGIKRDIVLGRKCLNYWRSLGESNPCFSLERLRM